MSRQLPLLCILTPIVMAEKDNSCLTPEVYDQESNRGQLQLVPVDKLSPGMSRDKTSAAAVS